MHGLYVGLALVPPDQAVSVVFRTVHAEDLKRGEAPAAMSSCGMRPVIWTGPKR